MTEEKIKIPNLPHDSNNINLDINLENTQKLLETIEKTKPKKPNLIQQTKPNKKVSFDLEQNSLILDNTIIESNNQDYFNLMNINIPKQTCYLALVMTTVGVLIWKLSKQHKKKEDE